ncbi:fimbrial protein [Stenotrophomonas maltophilia]|nr:fimbrial protein [Stenotrophomonas maltophilia]
MAKHVEIRHQHTAPWRRLCLKVALAVLACWAGPALAQSCAVYSEMRLDVGGEISFNANGSRLGQPISTWKEGAVRVGYCTDRNLYPGFSMRGASTTIPDTYEEGGASYSVFPTGIDGVGMIARVTTKVRNVEGPTVPLMANTTVEVWRAWAPGYNSSFEVGSKAAVRFIKIGDIAYGRHSVTMRTVGTGTMSSTQGPLAVASGTAIRAIDNPTCSVQTRQVNLGGVPLATFSGGGTGATSPTKTFDLELSCISAAGKIQYEIVPRGAILDDTKAVVELNNPGGSNTATGVGLQLLDGADKPVTFNTFVDFGNSAAAGMVRKSHGVRYFQLGTEAPTPGSADATMDVTLFYP